MNHQRYKDYEYSIEIMPVSPSIGELSFGATIDYLALAGAGKSSDPHLELGIVLGKSEVEARMACESKLRHWIDAQS